MNRSKSIPRAIALAIVIVAIAGSIYFVGTRFLGDAAVFIEGNREISEHAFTEKRFTYFYERESDFAYSKKKIKLEGDFVAKAGYKVNGTPNAPTNIFEINISEDGKRVTANLPSPEILSVEMIDFKIVTDEDGYWNKI